MRRPNFIVVSSTVPARSLMAMALVRSRCGAQRSSGTGTGIGTGIGAAPVLPGRSRVQLHAMPGRFRGILQVAGEVRELLDLRGQERMLDVHVLASGCRADEFACAAAPRELVRRTSRSPTSCEAKRAVPPPSLAEQRGSACCRSFRRSCAHLLARTCWRLARSTENPGRIGLRIFAGGRERPSVHRSVRAHRAHPPRTKAGAASRTAPWAAGSRGSMASKIARRIQAEIVERNAAICPAL